jgi:uncharacterized cupredoxin-like copper-binding protein
MIRIALPTLALAILAPFAAADTTVHLGTRDDGSMYVEPKTVRATQGERVKLTIVNDDRDKPHDWALLQYDGEDVEAYVEPGRSVDLAFTATEPGTYRVVCQLVGHKQLGMEGELVVEKKSAIPLPALAPALALALAALAWRRSSSR